jgi:hypothetical protein
MLSTIYLTIVALSTISYTFDDQAHALISSFFRLEPTNKGHIHLDLMKLKPIF